MTQLTICESPVTIQIQESQPHRIELRDYQLNIKRECYQLIKNGIKRILIYAPTGAGKTVILSSICQDVFSRNKRVMLIIHRDFLVEQSIDSMVRTGIDRQLIGVVKAGYKENRDRPIQIAGLQTLQNRATPDNIDVVILDECHTTAFYTHYSRIKLDTLDSVHLGFSASPWRQKPSEEYFRLHYDAIVLGPSIGELINKGNLVPPRYFGWGGIVDLSEVDTTNSGEYNLEQMQKKFIDSEIISEVVSKIQDLGSNRTGIIFNAGVIQSRLQTDALNKAGILTKHIDANTPFEERKQIFGELARGEIRCISSIGCLTEGFDVPSIGFIVLSRATKSRALYIQMCGRGLRTFPGKEDCLILDFGSNIKRIGYLTRKFKITLDPVRHNPEANLKECPNCGALVHIFAEICPWCGFVFGGERRLDDDDKEYEKKFGELFPPEILPKVRYVRSQRKTRFTKGLAPDSLWENYDKKHGPLTPDGAAIKNDWMLGAVFGGKTGKAYQQIFLTYLEKFAPAIPKYRDTWLKHHIDIEFGRNNQHQQHQHQQQSKSSNTYQIKNWADILGCSVDDTWEQIKYCYRIQCQLNHPDKAILLDRSEEELTEQMKLLNWAFSQAKLAKH